jgi:hypothetical protein
VKRPQLTPAAQEFADQIAEQTASRVAPMLRKLVDDALADWAPVCGCPSPLIVDESPRLPTSPPLPGPDRRCVRCGRRAA